MMGGTSSIVPGFVFYGVNFSPVSGAKAADDAVMLRRDQCQAGQHGPSAYVFQSKSPIVGGNNRLFTQLINCCGKKK